MFIYVDRTVRFWTTRLITSEPMDPKHQFEWEEWRMESADGNSSIEVPGNLTFFLFFTCIECSISRKKNQIYVGAMA